MWLESNRVRKKQNKTCCAMPHYSLDSLSLTILVIPLIASTQSPLPLRNLIGNPDSHNHVRWLWCCPCAAPSRRPCHCGSPKGVHGKGGQWSDVRAPILAKPTPPDGIWVMWWLFPYTFPFVFPVPRKQTRDKIFTETYFPIPTLVSYDSNATTLF